MFTMHRMFTMNQMYRMLEYSKDQKCIEYSNGLNVQMFECSNNQNATNSASKVQFNLILRSYRCRHAHTRLHLATYSQGLAETMEMIDLRSQYSPPSLSPTFPSPIDSLPFQPAQLHCIMQIIIIVCCAHHKA